MLVHVAPVLFIVNVESILRKIIGMVAADSSMHATIMMM